MTKAFAAQQFGTPESFPANRKLKKLTATFDKDRAGEVGIRAMGEIYYRVKESRQAGKCAALPPTKRNIAFMKDLVRLLCTLNSEPAR